MSPAGPQHRELSLDVREVGGEEQEPQKQHVVEGHARRRDLVPRERWRLANDPEQAGSGGQANGPGDRQRADALVELDDEHADPRGEQEHPDVEERPDLEADGDEAAPGDTVEEGGLPGREDVLRSQPGDGGDDVGVHSIT